MTNYVICERSLHHAHAGSKARDDIRQVLESQSWQPFEVRPGENKGYFDKLVCVGRTLADWHRLERTVRCGDVVLVQFPLIMYNKVSLYALPSVRRMKARGALFVFLIHDLETLRGYSYADFDKQWVTEADLLISHNPRMSEVLRKYGATVPIVEIGIFDYLLPQANPVPVEQRHGIDIAGNLSHAKPNTCIGWPSDSPKPTSICTGRNMTGGTAKRRGTAESSHPMNCQTNWKDDLV